MQAADLPLCLIPLAGPATGPAGGGSSFTIQPNHPVTIGRAAASDIALLDDAVSRRHASISHRRTGWFIADEGSRGGTFVNGVKLPASAPAPIVSGDLIRIGPWAYRVVIGDPPTASPSTFDDSPTQKVHRAGATHGLRSERRLHLLSECIVRLNAAETEGEAAHIALESALHGSGYARGAILRRLPAADRSASVDVITSVRADPADAQPFLFSRTLIEQANAGETVALTGSQPVDYAQSIADLGVHSALCVPVNVSGSVTGYLYFDARGRESAVKADATAFCESLAIAFGLATANLERDQLEQRQALMQRELAAAREVQQLLMPPVQGAVGCVQYAARSLPGSFVAGDLFDIVDLAGSGVAICLGDVSGHGAGSAMLMAAAQAFLSAELRHLGAGKSPRAAVAALNRFMCERPLAGRFLSLWVGVLFPDGRLVFVDAGHGHWLHLRADGAAVISADRQRGGGIPIGIDPAAEYADATITLSAGDRVLAYSDGIPEQRNARGEVFGLGRLHHAVSGANTPAEDVKRLFSGLEAFMGTPMLDDDATAASIGLCGDTPA